jgi:hypothetical protein
MSTVDSLLSQVYRNLKQIETKIDVKDKRIIASLYKQVTQHEFLTLNQSKLLVKIFMDNLKSISIVEPLASDILASPTWSREFRVIEKIRKIYQSSVDNSMLCIEFNYDKRLKSILALLNGRLEGGIGTENVRTYTVPMTEKNIFLVVNEFMNEGFSIDQKILIFYQEIEEIINDKNISFDVFSENNINLRSLVEDRVASISADNLVVLHDRKLRYQYTVGMPLPEKSLKNSIAQRPQPKIFIDSKTTDLAELIKSLKELNRLPVLAIFEGHDPKVNKSTLDLLQKALEKNEITDNVGIYFRFGNVADTAGFNETISNLKYNSLLTDQTNLAGIANTKLPKFMIKSEWKPQSVISFTTSFRNNKSSVYCNDVDLIVYYTDKQPLHGGVSVIL